MRCDCALAENPLLHVDVVVDGVECLSCGEPRPFEEDTRDDLAIPPCEVLADLDVVQVVLEVAAVEKGEIGGNLRLLCLESTVQILECLLQFAAPPLRLIAADEFVTRTEQFVLSVREVDGDVLIVFGDLFAEVAAARVDDEVVRAVRAAVDLDEVIAAAERAKAACDALRVLEGAVAAQPEEVESLLPPVPEIAPRRDEVCRRIEAYKVDLALAEVDRIHPAADVDTDEIRDDLVPHSHCRADRAALAPVHIGHDADARPLRELVVTHAADLLHRLVLDYLCICNRRAAASAYLHAFHYVILLIYSSLSSLPCHSGGS